MKPRIYKPTNQQLVGKPRKLESTNKSTFTVVHLRENAKWQCLNGCMTGTKLNPTFQLIMVLLQTKYEVAAAYSCYEFCKKKIP